MIFKFLYEKFTRFHKINIKKTSDKKFIAYSQTSEKYEIIAN